MRVRSPFPLLLLLVLFLLSFTPSAFANEGSEQQSEGLLAGGEADGRSELVQVGLSDEQATLILDANTQMARAIEQGASSAEIEKMARRFEQELSGMQTPMGTVSNKWIGRLCARGAQGSYRVDRGPYASSFLRLGVGVSLIHKKVGISTATGKYYSHSTSIPAAFGFHTVVANNPRNHSAGCR